MATIKKMAKSIHENAINHGWWEREVSIPEFLCLIHSEVSEALEEYRRSSLNPNWETSFAEELADIVIRTFDLAEGLGVDIEKEIIKKHKKNISRSYRHGGKVC
jgi:NTP pyrophosphatase (non-canonical NTP hydrolase)